MVMLRGDWLFAEDLNMPALSFESPEIEFDWGGKCPPPRAKRRPFTWAQKAILVSWLSTSMTNSVRRATQEEVNRLAAATDLTPRQVRAFLVNWRVRHRGQFPPPATCGRSPDGVIRE
jgi:hypothetical protein